MAHYIPPTQSKISQIIDVIVLVALTVGALFVPLWLGMAGAAKTVTTPVENPTWEALGQNAAQAAQYELHRWGADRHDRGDRRLLRPDAEVFRSGVPRGHLREIWREIGAAMETWNYIEYAAWGLSALFGLHMVMDWFKTDSTYSEDVLTSSREGELEAMTEESHKG
jgi:hypothetical protein